MMVKVYDPTKMQEKLHRPYPILELWTNGMVCIQQVPLIVETLNIWKIVPHKGKASKYSNHYGG